MGVAGFVLFAGWNLGKQTIDVLIDTAPEGVEDVVRELAGKIPDVAMVQAVRARRSGNIVLIELKVRVSRILSLEKTQAVQDEIERAVRAHHPACDLVVIAEPLTLADEEVAATIRAAAAFRGLAVCNIVTHSVAENRHVGFDLEIDSGLSIREAHDVASELEHHLARELGREIAIDIHIDPRCDRNDTGKDADAKIVSAVEAAVRNAVSGHSLVRGFHKLVVRQASEGLYASFHCTFPEATSLKEAHDETTRLEYEVRSAIKGVSRLIVHAEPEEHVDRS